jgi:hypothetical protein
MSDQEWIRFDHMPMKRPFHNYERLRGKAIFTGYAEFSEEIINSSEEEGKALVQNFIKGATREDIKQLLKSLLYKDDALARSIHFIQKTFKGSTANEMIDINKQEVTRGRTAIRILKNESGRRRRESPRTRGRHWPRRR